VLRPSWRPGEEPAAVDPVRVAHVAAEFGFPADKLVDALNYWLETWTYWRRTTTRRQQARDRWNKKARRAEERGDTAGAEEARARLHRGTALAARLDRLASKQPCPALAEQMWARADAVRRRPPLEATEPELTRCLATLWLEYRRELPSPGSGEGANEFVQFVTACAAALRVHAPPEEDAAGPARWRDRWRRDRARIVEWLKKGRAIRR
jgi:hypothetical protein